MDLKEQQEQFNIIIEEVKQTMFKKGNDYANNESIEDSMLDLTCYSILLKMIQSEVAEKPKKFTKEEIF